MYDAVANVGVKDGRIAVITKDKIKGKETIDAKGLVVAPGFIDGHQHCIEPYQYRLMLRDGRTTLLDTEIGAHGPKLDEWYKRREGKAPVNFGVAVAHEFARAEVLDGFTDWKHLYTPDAEKTRSTKVKIDGKETIKEGWSKTRPTLEQGNQILALIDEGLAAGRTWNWFYRWLHARGGIGPGDIRTAKAGRALWPLYRHAFPLYAR